MFLSRFFASTMVYSFVRLINAKFSYRDFFSSSSFGFDLLQIGKLSDVGWLMY